jgi:uncharacterized membrane protein
MAVSSSTPPVPPPVAATVHIYRGLMDRGTTWRQRVDNPTNWAIVSIGTTVSFALSDDAHSHAVLMLVMLFSISFLAIEARRTRYYDLWSSWLRLLETEYLAPILQDNCVTASDTWQELIVRDLGYPHFKSTTWRMVQRRLRDHYMAIYLFLLFAWLLKLLQPGVDAGTCDTFVCHAAVGPIPGGLILGIVSCFYLVLGVTTLMGYSGREPSVEVLSRERTLQKLVSPLQQPVNRRPWHHERPAYSSDDDDRPPED